MQPETKPNQTSSPAKRLYDEAIHAELSDLLSETEILFQKLQSLSRQRLAQTLAQSGVAK
jgi:hypothetical protein